MLIKSDYFNAKNHFQPRVAVILGCQKNLMALSSHMLVSKEPFRYALGIKEENITHSMLMKHGSCTLNFLPFKYFEAIDICGRNHGGDKLLESKLSSKNSDANGNVIIDQSSMVFVCNVIDTYQNGDYTLFIVDITESYINEEVANEPTLFFGQGRYGTITQYLQAPKHNKEVESS